MVDYGVKEARITSDEIKALREKRMPLYDKLADLLIRFHIVF